MKNLALTAVVVVLWAGEALAQPMIDGSVDGAYGTALSVQNTRSHFGDATSSDVIDGGDGSEIDQVFATVADGRLYVMIAGNLQKNFNKMEVFIDSVSGGVNEIDGSTLPTGVDGFCCGMVDPNVPITGGALQSPGIDFLKFDSGFEADYYLTFTHGGESVNNTSVGTQGFWAMTAHYAELNEGTDGDVISAGMQLAYNGHNYLLRPPGDFNGDGNIDAADYPLWRDTLGDTVARGVGANSSLDDTVGEEDYNNWKANFGSGRGMNDLAYVPFAAGNVATEALVTTALPGLSQGELIDRNYALSLDGGCTDDTGAGCIAPELEFALDVDPGETGTNESNHRNLDNSVLDLRMAFNNSNTAGVLFSDTDFPLVEGEDDPENVTTGLEFSVPLSQIGDPGSGSDIKMTIYINGTTHDHASNQWSGVGILAANPGGLPPDLSTIAGDQFVTVSVPGAGGGSLAGTVPEPASGVLALLAGLAACCLVRRK